MRICEHFYFALTKRSGKRAIFRGTLKELGFPPRLDEDEEMEGVVMTQEDEGSLRSDCLICRGCPLDPGPSRPEGPGSAHSPVKEPSPC